MVKITTDLPGKLVLLPSIEEKLVKVKDLPFTSTSNRAQNQEYSIEWREKHFKTSMYLYM